GTAVPTSMYEFADVAQLVEHTLGKGEVTGSIPVVSSDILGKCSSRLGATVAPASRLVRPASGSCHAPRQDHSRLQPVQKTQLIHHQEQEAPSGARRVEEVLPALQQASDA